MSCQALFKSLRKLTKPYSREVSFVRNDYKTGHLSFPYSFNGYTFFKVTK